MRCGETGRQTKNVMNDNVKVKRQLEDQNEENWICSDNEQKDNHLGRNSIAKNIEVSSQKVGSIASELNITLVLTSTRF